MTPIASPQKCTAKRTNQPLRASELPLTTNPIMQKEKEAGEMCGSAVSSLQGALEKPEDASSLNSGWEQSPGVRGKPPTRPFLRRTPIGARRSCNASFKSPVPCPRASPPADKDTLQREIEELKCKDVALDQEIAQLSAEGYSVEELENHITLLHKYNEIKDTGQMLLGQIAMIRGVTTKELYPEFELDLND